MFIRADRAGPAHRGEDRRVPGRGRSSARRPATCRRRWSPSSPRRCSTTSRPGFYFVVVVTALILVLAANTAFNGFPVLGSILSQDRYLPRQLHTRGDRLAFSNGILVLAGDRDRAGGRLPGRGHPADPALHRRACSSRSRSARPACCGTGNGCWPPRPTRPTRRRMRALAGDQRVRRGDDRRRAGHRADHQVHPRRVDRDRRDGGVLRADAGHPAGTTTGSPPSWWPASTTACCPRATTRIVLVSTLHKPTLRARRLRPGHPARRAGGGHRQRRRRRHQEARCGSGSSARSRCR